MPDPGKLEIVVKFNQLPTGVTTDKNGWKHFTLDCGEKKVRVGMRPKNWTKLEKAVADWPLWVASLGGTFFWEGEGLAIPEASVQVFERKAKAEGPATPAG